LNFQRRKIIFQGLDWPGLQVPRYWLALQAEQVRGWHCCQRLVAWEQPQVSCSNQGCCH
jgi:hypothetical protein